METAAPEEPGPRHQEEVPQGGSLVGYPGDAVTRGLGPCIGLAFVSEGKAFLLHVWSAHVHEAAAEFFAQVADRVPQSSRSAIAPTICGGSIDGGRVEGRRSRAWVLSKLKKLGFASPNVSWCSPGCAQDLEIAGGLISITERRLFTEKAQKRDESKKERRSRNKSKASKPRSNRGTSAP